MNNEKNTSLSSEQQLSSDHIAMLVDAAEGIDGNLILASYGQNPTIGTNLEPRIKHLPIPASTSEIAELAKTAHKWAQEKDRNAYIPLSVMRPDLSASCKGGEADIVAVLGLVTDFDDADAANWENRLPLSPDVVLETSPVRFQAFYLLDKPATVDEAKGIAVALSKYARVDTCSEDVSHVWRVPGTLNWPNKKKVDEGRSPEPVMVTTVKPWNGNSRTSLEVLRAALESKGVIVDACQPDTPREPVAASHDEQEHPPASPIPPDLMELIVVGVSQGQRSQKFQSAVNHLRDLGYSERQIYDLFDANPCGIAEKYYEQGTLAKNVTVSVEKAKVYRPAPSFPPVTDDEIKAIDRIIEQRGNWVVEINKTHFVSQIGGKVFVVNEIIDEDQKEVRYEFLTFESFNNKFKNRKALNEKRNMVPLGPEWQHHPMRRQYLGGMVFRPEQDVPQDCFNIWKGWSVQPRPGNWPRLYHHILNILCGGNQDMFDWLLNWCAHLFQRPWEKAEVAIVMRGGQGTGKGTFAHVFKKIIGPHYRQVTNAKHFVGQFNAHLEGALCIFVDEAFFANDLRIDGQLKAMITEPTINIERKGVDVVTAPNLSHILMASNCTHVVNADVDARRFLILDIRPDAKQDHDYFGALYAEMDNGGLAAFLHDMLSRDISNFNHRRAPNTEALTDEKINSLRGVRKWWFTLLADAGTEAEWVREVEKSTLYKNYQEWSRGLGQSENRPDPSPQFWQRHKEICTISICRPRGNLGERRRLVTLPPLSKAREQFEKVIGSKIDWSKYCG